MPAKKADLFNPECPSRKVLQLVGTKWSLLILCALHDRKRRTGELKRLLDGVSQKMLTQTLREMEDSGLVRRESFPEVPPRVEYELTELGRSLSTLVVKIEAWIAKHFPALLKARRESRRRAESAPGVDAMPRNGRGRAVRRHEPTASAAPAGIFGKRAARQPEATATPARGPDARFGGFQLTPRMVASHIRRKPFVVISAALERGHFVTMDDVLPEDALLALYREFKHRLPSPAEVADLRMRAASAPHERADVRAG